MWRRGGTELVGFPGNSVVKNLPANGGDVGLIPGSGISPGGGNGNLPQYSYLENPIDKGAWRATVHRSHKVSNTTENTRMHTGMCVNKQAGRLSMPGRCASKCYTY